MRLLCKAVDSPLPMQQVALLRTKLPLWIPIQSSVKGSEDHSVYECECALAQKQICTARKAYKSQGLLAASNELRLGPTPPYTNTENSNFACLTLSSVAAGSWGEISESIPLCKHTCPLNIFNPLVNYMRCSPYLRVGGMCTC